jgi:plastocyanin
MRRAFPVSVVLLILVALPAEAKDVYLSIAGSIGSFRTDARIWNPSSSKDITISAYFLPVGKDNSGVTPVQITVPKRSMKVFDDVVASLFNVTGTLGGIRLASSDDFVATSRIYAQVKEGTLGQFVEGLDESSARTKGVIIQLKTSTAFRTNIGYVNPNSSAATITLRLYDHSNNLVGQPVVETALPFSASSPSSMASIFNIGNADLTDAWVSFSSNMPVYAYGSVVDSGTTDPTYVPFAEDSDPDATSGSNKIFDFVARSFQFTVSPDLLISPGDHVTFRISNNADIPHGFTVVGPDNKTVIGPLDILPGQGPITKTFTAIEGTYTYGCSHVTCGVGHSTMVGSFIVGSEHKDPPPGY